jgi:2-oxoglutarate dehydrogenase E2 component (dihydrolipoamide succinyltransferase)
MATEIRVPTLGESVSEATIGTWFKKVGDAIKADEPLVELETDKVTIEVPAPASGTLSEILANAGDTVEVNALLGQIAEGAAASKTDAPSQPAASASSVTEPKAEPAQASNGSAMPAAPSAQKMMSEKNVSADQVEGSGKRWQILKGDVIDAINKAPDAGQ